MAREPTIKFWVWVPSIIESTRRGRHRSTLCKEYIGLGFHKRTAKAPPRLVLFIVKFLLGEGRTKPEKIVAEAVQLSSKQFEELLGAMISFANKPSKTYAKESRNNVSNGKPTIKLYKLR